MTKTRTAELEADKAPATAAEEPESPSSMSLELQTPVVSAHEWQDAIDRFRAKEKRATRERDALAAERRRLPRLRMEREYVFEGEGGRKSLRELFDGRRQLIVYHFMFAPGVDGWPDAGCPGCSMFTDQISHLSHLHARDTTLVLVSRGPFPNLRRYQRRMGWTVPWYSSHGTSFNVDMGATTDHGETHLLSVFVREGDEIYRAYVTGARGVEALGSVWTFLDLTPLGRQETWEDSPPGYPQTEPYVWWRRHDEYGAARPRA